jgi:hypothetical protein
MHVADLLREERVVRGLYGEVKAGGARFFGLPVEAKLQRLEESNSPGARARRLKAYTDSANASGMAEAMP